MKCEMHEEMEGMGQNLKIMKYILEKNDSQRRDNNLVLK